MHTIRLLSGVFLEGLRDFFLPPLCLGCGIPPGSGVEEPVFPAALFCDRCLSRIRLLDGVICPSCGQPGVSDAFLCPRCRGAFRGLSRAVAGAAYSDLVRELVLRLKFGGQRVLAYPLAGLAQAGARRATASIPADCIVPVPLHPSRLRSRGFNQAELIADHLAAALDIPSLKGVVRRSRKTLPQGVGGGGSRRRNVRGAFTPVRDGIRILMKGEVPGRAVAGLHVMLVDDVLSTGATLDDCGRALLEAGACRVTGVAAAT